MDDEFLSSSHYEHSGLVIDGTRHDIHELDLENDAYD